MNLEEFKNKLDNNELGKYFDSYNRFCEIQ